MNEWLERRFCLAERGTSVRTEVVAGATTFATMAYILFVQPVVLGKAGMDPGAVLVATCVASALACLLMAFLANYPVALAPGMGHNFYFTYAVVLGMKVPWTVALGAIAIAGTIFILLAGVGLREKLIEVIPSSLKRGIAAGIGLLITLVGLEYGGLVVHDPATGLALGSLRSPAALLTVLGLAVSIALLVRRSRLALLAGISVTTVASLALGYTKFSGFVSTPPSLAPTFLKLDPLGALTPAMAPVIFVFLFLALFDTVGTLVGVSEKAGLMTPDGRLPKAREALLADSISTVVGAVAGTSTVTSYIESAAGVSAGGRTGLTSVVTAALLLLSLFFTPLVQMVSGDVMIGGVSFHPAIAPSLILVGYFMIEAIAGIPWHDEEEAVPAFLAIVIMPMALSITEGIAFGFIAYSFIKLVKGKAAQTHWLVHLFAALFLLRYAFLTR